MAAGLHIAVVGAGVSGLAAAYHLQRAGHRVDLIERESEAGGRCGVSRLGGRPVMAGGRLIGRKYTAFREFLTALGPFALEPFATLPLRCTDDTTVVVDHRDGPAALRYLFRMGAAPPDIAKFAYLARQARDTGGLLPSGYYTKLAALSDHKPLSQHFGATVTETALRPMTVWTHGAEPDEMYLGAFGATLATVLDDFDQLTDGLQPVIAALSRRVTLRRRTAAHRLMVRRERVHGLELAENGGPPREYSYDAVLLATPAPIAAGLVSDGFPALGKLLGQIRYLPATVVLAEYRRPIFAPGIASLTFDDGPCRTVAPYGADRRELVRYTFTGRAARPVPSPAALRTWLARAEERTIAQLGIEAVVRRRAAVWRWPGAYCAYLPFHGEFVGRLNHEVPVAAGLALAGDYLLGTSLEACVRSGAGAAEQLLAGAQR
ncbi:protoporphyrinogen/coproporphyrinogen oxidase [Nocardia amamiensis]|uniref:protoporphyrinogen/coproporphyrinogen oxidase n=1 Tax=Nocardia amamiensis TaxID=404578 RepID=UPI00082F8265|nr:FAD-dependent oxidoreductase [Nocardia amamiensis]